MNEFYTILMLGVKLIALVLSLATSFSMLRHLAYGPQSKEAEKIVILSVVLLSVLAILWI
ncbi:MAG: hypothetical protein ACP5RK_00245 [Candidatus Micrarchaeia archaeon]